MEQFDEFSAQYIYCPDCKEAMPVVKNLLLVLPSGNLYDYRCKACGKSLGSQTNSGREPNPDFR